MAGIDSRLIIVGLPTIASELKAGQPRTDLDKPGLPPSKHCLPTTNREIGGYFGKIKLYNLGFLVFTIGSGLSAISSDATQLFHLEYSRELAQA